MTIWKMAVRMAWLGVAAFLAGCVTSPKPISGEHKLTGQEGAVVFKFVTNGATTADPAETLSSITLKRELPPDAQPTAQDTIVLWRTRAVTNSTAVFSGMVAPGRYYLLHAGGTQGNIIYTYPLRSRFSRFEVKSGEVSLLGTILVQPLEGKKFTVGYVPPDAELLESYEGLFPALAQQTRGKPFHTFEPSPEMTRSTELAVRLRDLASAYNGLHADTDGTVLAGSKLGRVVRRKAGDSRWRMMRLDTWKEVLSVRSYRGGLLAAGEEGLLRYSSDEGRTWKPLTPPDGGLIGAVAPMADGKVIALVRRDTQWTAYVTRDVFAGNWRRIGTFEQQHSYNLPWQNAIPVVSGSRAGILMPNGDFHVVDGNTEAIERSTTGVSTLTADVMPDGMLVVQGAIMTRTTLVSANGGKTWTDLNTNRFVRAVTFTDPHTAYAIGPVDPGLFAGAYALMVSHDGAKTWKKSGEVPGGLPDSVRTLFYDRGEKSLFAFLQNGQILRSVDEGKSWTRSL